jgi:DNA-directed RNA polymerase subunit alpha
VEEMRTVLDLELPSITKTTMKGNSARYKIEPVDAGYALSLASALRRTLLSSLEGAAITSILIKGVQHEFQAIPDIKEDVVDLVFNIKKVRLRSYANRPVTVYLEAKGEGVVTAGDIRGPSTIEIVNPELHIATLDNERADIDMQLVIGTGRGFVPIEVQAEQRTEHQPIGVILVDALYSPVVKVNFTIEAIRRERKENLDRIILEITTDGTISPDEAFRQSAAILRDQFVVFTSHEYERDIPKKPAHASAILIPSYIYNMGIEELQLSFRVYNTLKRCGITQVGHLLVMDERELLLLRNFGARSFQELVDRMRVKEFLPKEDEEVSGR